MQKTFLFVSAQYLPTAGGVERYTNHLARKLIALGHRVIVVTSSLKDLPDHEVDEWGIEIFRLPAIPLMNGRLPVLRPGRKFCRMARELWQRSIDACIINTYFYPLSMYAARTAKKHHIPSIVINHGSAWLMTGGKLVQLAGRVYERCAVGVCSHCCGRFFGVSEMAKQWLTTFGITPEGIITNAIDPEDLLATVNREKDWRAVCGLPRDAKIIAFVGRMIPEKGVEPLLAAMASIRSVLPGAWLLMAGNGPLLDQYRNAQPEGVILLDVQPYPDVLALLQQADVFCLPSRSEGFACTVLEAAALGCPVITTATGGSSQLLIDESYGILLGDMAPETISQACIQALMAEGWRRKASILAKQRVEGNFTWDVAVKQLLDVFSEETK